MELGWGVKKLWSGSIWGGGYGEWGRNGVGGMVSRGGVGWGIWERSGGRGHGGWVERVGDREIWFIGGGVK